MHPSNISNTSGLVEGLDYYVPWPRYMMIIISTITSLAAIANVAQLALLWHTKTQNRRNMAAFGNYISSLYVLGSVDALVSISRMALTNKAGQDFLLQYRAGCIASAVFNSALMVIGSSVILLIGIDRLVSTVKLVDYQHSFMWTHYNKILISIIISCFAFYISLGVAFRDIGFRVKGIAGCKKGSEKFPALGLISVAIVFVEFAGICCSCIGVMYRMRNCYFHQSRRIRQATKRNHVITKTLMLLLLGKILTWIPMMVTAAIRPMKIKCSTCEMVGLSTMYLNAIINPFCYGRLTFPQKKKSRIFAASTQSAKTEIERK